MSKTTILSLANQKLAARRTEVVRTVDDREIPKSLLSFAKNKFFYIRTYGCQANVRDEEIMAGYLTKAGFSRTDDPHKANVAIINTCAVRENAEEKVYGEIGSYKKNKESDDGFILVIAGCVMGEDEMAEKLVETYPWISLLIGTHDVANINQLLAEVIEKKKTLINIRSLASEVVENLPSVRLSPFEAYVNISYGCDKFCTYCIVPYTRGRERSRRMEDILKECEELVREGYKQITLLGQNVNSYGLDFHDGTTFATLLEKVAQTGIPHLRFLTSYPSQFTDEMIEAMSTYPNIDHWLHFPVQSGSSNCLKRMGRRYTREEYLEIVSRIKKKIPDISLTTDIIVGFPNESEEEFQETLSLCKEVGFSSAFTFIYSPRSGTPAAKMKQVPPEVSHERFNRLKALIDELTAKSSDECLGKVLTVLVNGPSKKNEEVLTGYASNGKLVNFPGPKELTGSLAKVKILASHVYSLKGELVEDPLVVKAKDVAFYLRLDPILKEYLSLEGSCSSMEIKELASSLVEAKKKMALALGDENKYSEAKSIYDAIVNKISHHPLLNNKDALLEEVEDRLAEVRDFLK